MQPLLSLSAITKSFGGIQALGGVEFDLRPGEIHALCGENGAGKSTLMRIVAGELHQDGGEIRLNGSPVRIPSPLAARRHGILLVHQEISLVPQLSVAENLYLGALPRGRFGRLDRRALERQAKAVLASCGYDIDPNVAVEHLSVAMRQAVEMARAWAFNASVVILDEPTASLTQTEAEKLFDNLARLKERGIGIIYISHKMDEVFRLCDRITVLRDGKSQGTFEAAQTTEAAITELMFGRSLDTAIKRPMSRPGAELLRIEAMSVPNCVDDASFAIREGEVLGCYGLVGSGRTEMVEAILGFRARSSGAISWRGEQKNFTSPRDAYLQGIGFVPEDRRLQGLVLGLSGRANLALTTLSALSRWGVVRPRAERDLYEHYRNTLNIRSATGSLPVDRLSGGNQQKIVLAKWLATHPSLLILDEPTRGVDVGAKAQIYALISQLAESGMAILLISSEMPEVLGLSHRILTFREGRITGEVEGAAATEHQLADAIMEKGAGPLRKPSPC